MQDLMDLIGQLQERYQIDQADIDTLVTDKAPGEAWDETLAQKQVKLIH